MFVNSCTLYSPVEFPVQRVVFHVVAKATILIEEEVPVKIRWNTMEPERSSTQAGESTAGGRKPPPSKMPATQHPTGAFPETATSQPVKGKTNILAYQNVFLGTCEVMTVLKWHYDWGDFWRPLSCCCSLSGWLQFKGFIVVCEFHQSTTWKKAHWWNEHKVQKSYILSHYLNKVFSGEIRYFLALGRVGNIID